MKRNRTNEMDIEPVVSPSIAVSSEEKTVIGKQIIIEGTVQGKEDLLIEGSVKGSIELTDNHLTVGINGQVESDIQARDVTIKGHLSGKIDASDKVSISKEAEFTGDIHAKRISIEDGAYLKAVVELEKQSRKKNLHSIKLAEDDVSKESSEVTGFVNEADEAK